MLIKLVGTWERLAHAEVTGSAGTLVVSSIPARENLMIVCNMKHAANGTAGYFGLVFNDDGSSEANGKYASRRAHNGGADQLRTSSDSLYAAAINGAYSETNWTYTVTHMNNNSGRVKLCKSYLVGANTSGAYLPRRVETAATWHGTDQVNKIQLTDAEGDKSVTWAVGSYITVYGASDDVVTDEKTTLTNVPANTRYEETDTRKIYRSKSVGFPNGTSGSGSDWTEVAFDSSTSVNNGTASGNVVTRSSYPSSGNWESYIRSSTHYLDPSEGGGEVYFTVSNNSHVSMGLEKSPYNEYPTAVYQDRNYSFHTTTATNNMYEKTSSYDGTDWNNATNEWRITMDSAGLVKYYYRVNSSGSWNLERTSTVTASGKYYVTASPNSSASCTCYIKSDAAIAWKERGTA